MYVPLQLSRLFSLAKFHCISDLLTSGLSLVVGLVLYISSINDEMLNRTKTNEAYFSYKYGWSFAFAAVSFLLTEVTFALIFANLCISTLGLIH